MANLLCAKPLQGEVLRVTRLDECGNPEFGDDAYGVSDGFISVTLTPEVEEGESFFVRNANGRTSIDERGKPDLRWYTVTAVFQEVDPELLSILTGLDPYLDYSGQTAGFVVTKEKFATANFALEIWMGNAEGACLPGDPYPFYGYNLLPWIVEGALMEDIAITNAPITFTVVGRTRTGTPWGTGPYDVMRDQTDAPAPLPTPIPSDTHHLPIWTQLAPPEAMCGTAGISS
jgi:hypothetical protein